jgi:hypothetical protein
VNFVVGAGGDRCTDVYRRMSPCRALAIRAGCGYLYGTVLPRRFS